tara:strand:- start:1707 stop:2663 length:957 start_codon:yes stop_codon:yes gene_type:complete
MLSKSKIKTIVIGLGNIGLDYDLNNNNSILSHSKSVLKSKHFELVAAIEKNKKKRDIFKKKYKKQTFEKLGSFLKKKIKFDLAIISTNTADHFKTVKKLDKYDYKYCLLEKPGGKNFNEHKKIIKILKNKKVKLIINYFRNYLNPYQKLKKSLNKKNVCYFFYNRGLINNCSHLISFCIKNFGNEKNIKIINKDKENPSFRIKFKNADAFFFNIGIKNCGQNKLLLFNSDRYIESKESFNSFVSIPATSSDLIKNTFDYNEKKSQIILNNDNKAQLHVLDYLYKIRNSDKKFNYYNKLNYNTYKLLDKIRRINNEKNN